MIQSRIPFALIITVVLMLGCSSGMQDPVTPSINGESVNQLTGSAVVTPQSPTYLWGFYELYFDVENGTIEATPGRSVEFTANVTGFLNNDPQGLAIKFNGTTSGTGFIDIDMDITIKHPLDQHQFDGYDVRGVFIGDGTIPLQSNPDLVYADAATEQIVLNADGYTRWYNPTEFLAPGIFGYIPGNLASKGYTPTATLNPYKIFAKGLSPDEDYWDYLNTATPETGYFLAGTSNTRNYQIRFPIPVPGIKYGYAVIANWSGTSPSDHPSHAPEALGVYIHDSSSVFYEGPSTNGGNLVLDIQVFDWDAVPTSAVMEDYLITIESTVLSAPYTLSQVEMTPTEIGQFWGMYHVEIPADNITDDEGNEVWVIVEDADADYTNPMGVPNNADTDKLAGFFRHSLHVIDEEPLWVKVTNPNGGEEWKIGGTGEITWDSNPDISNVAILLSLNSGLDFTQLVTLFTENDGSYTWDPIPFYAAGTNNRIMIMSVEDTSIHDRSDADFAVTSTSVNVTNPNGGEQWKGGTAEEITWEADPDIPFVRIEFSWNNGVDYQYVITPETQNDGSYIWNPVLTGVTSFGCFIKVSDAACPEVFDISDESFELIQPGITLTSPNGGEELEGYMTWEITWDCTETGGTVSLEYSTDDFLHDINTIVNNTDNDGSYTWDPIPFDLSDTVSIRIIHASPAMSDVSDAYFSIVEPEPFIRIITPNGGEELRSGHSAEITWLSHGITGDVKIDYSNDNFASDVNEVTDSTPNTGSYAWDPVSGEISDTIRIRVMSIDSPELFDISDGDLSIIEAGWARTWGYTSYDTFSDSVTDADGNCYVLANGLDLSDLSNDSNLIKYDNAGKIVWEISWGGDTQQEGPNANYIGINGDGDIYIAGFYRGTVDFDPGPGVDNHTTIDQYDVRMFVSRFDTDGNWYWTETFGGTTSTQDNSTRAMGVTTSDIYLAGWFHTTVDFDPDPVDTQLRTPIGYYDSYLLRLSTSGDFLWVGTWGTTGGEIVEPTDLELVNGNVYVGGFFRNTCDFDPGAGVNSKTSNGSDDAYISWFDDMNIHQGVVAWGDTSYDGVSALAVDALGNVYACGYFVGTDNDFDPGPGVDPHTSIGSYDNFLVKYDPSMQYVWGRSWGSTGDDSAYYLEADGAGNPVVAGNFSASDEDFDPGPGEDIHGTNGGQDCYFSMFDAAGNYLGVRTFGGTDYDRTTSVHISHTGNIFVTGDFRSILMDFAPSGAPCFEDPDLRSTTGTSDGFLIKYMPGGCW